MASPAVHYAKAEEALAEMERLLGVADESDSPIKRSAFLTSAPIMLGMAQVHATLATCMPHTHKVAQ